MVTTRGVFYLMDKFALMISIEMDELNHGKDKKINECLCKFNLCMCS